MSIMHPKRLCKEIVRRHQSKQLEDRVKISKMPERPAIREAVRQAQMTLIQISGLARSQGHEKLDAKVQNLANTCIVGIIFNDGFPYRCGEWEQMKLSIVNGAIANDLDYLVCLEHKTSDAYGASAKYIAPGVKEAIRCYINLPRCSDVDLFLCPPGGKQLFVSVPKALFLFSVRFLPSADVKPTVNLLRKKFHTKLIKKTYTEQKCFEWMQRIDGHTENVARKHYVLLEPEDDAKLAKALVGEVLGETVSWPQCAELQTPDEVSEVLCIMVDLRPLSILEIFKSIWFSIACFS